MYKVIYNQQKRETISVWESIASLTCYSIECPRRSLCEALWANTKDLEGKLAWVKIPDVWLFHIWHLFDNLTYFNILTHNLNHLSPSQGYFSYFNRKTFLSGEKVEVEMGQAESSSVMGSSQQTWTSDLKVKGGCPLIMGGGGRQSVNNTTPEQHPFLTVFDGIFGSINK